MTEIKTDKTNIERATVPADPGTVMNFYGVEVPVKEFLICKTGSRPSTLPVIETMSDYTWQYRCLVDRLEHPDQYRATEDVDAVIEKLRKWLKDHADERDEFLNHHESYQVQKEILK
ncbi:MAG: hypothetical protein ACI39E_00265 [Acutalibacteraceae bacterium]